MASGSFVFDEVESIKWLPPEETFDISTDAETQSYLAEHVFTHNSTTLINFGYAPVTFTKPPENGAKFGPGYNVVHYTCEWRRTSFARNTMTGLRVQTLNGRKRTGRNTWGNDCVEERRNICMEI